MAGSYVLVVLVLCSLGVAMASCPANCSSHGTCQNNVCNCQMGYAGIDCSIGVTMVSSEGTVSPQTETFEWAYFFINVSSTATKLSVMVQEADSSCDTDAYIRYQMLPDHRRYDYRDTSSDKREYQLDVPHPEAGIWFIGIFVWNECEHYTVHFEVDENLSCPSGCSAHGACLPGGLCQCDDNYFGEDCSEHIQPLEVGHSITVEVDLMKFQYYYFDASHNVPFTVTVNEDRSNYPNGDCDMYIKFGSKPQLFDFDYRDPGFEADYSITVTQPEEGTYFIGIFGFQPVKYTISVSEAGDTCGNACSNHGECRDNRCHCESMFEGTNCETMIPEMPVGHNVEGLVEQQSWNYYHITPSTSDNMEIRVQQIGSDPGEDCDVYVNDNSNPTLFQFQDLDLGLSSNITLVVENPQGTTWHIGVYGYTRCEYRIRIKFGARCPDGCEDHGKCEDGRCVCDENYLGDACTDELHVLENKTPANGAVKKNEWSYYALTTSPGSVSVMVDMHEIMSGNRAGKGGDLWLYVNQGTPPTLDTYLWSNTNEETRYHNIYFQRDNTNEDDRYFIGVYGSPLIPDAPPGEERVSIQYELVGYFPDFA